MEFNWTQFLVLSLAMAIGAALQASVGYGMGLLVTPVLILFNPDLIPAPFILAAFLMILLMTLRERQALDFWGLRWVLVGAIPGIIAGTALLSILSQRQFNLAFGVLILFAVALSACGLRFPMRRGVLSAAGFLSGVMGVMGGIGGPPLALVYQDASPDRLRATVSGYFIISTILTLGSLAGVGHFGWEDFQLSLQLIPGVMVGFLLSYVLVKRIGSAPLRPYVLSLSAAAGLVVIAQQILG